MIKTTYILYGIEKSLAFEWIVEHNNRSNIELSFILIHREKDTALQKFLDINDIPNYFISYHSKKDLPKAFLLCYQLLNQINPKVVHTHLFEANFIGLIAAKLVGVKKRIYTRHYATLNHTYYPNTVKWDKLINYLATDIISISGATYYALVNLERVNPNKIISIPHGFDIDMFRYPNNDAVIRLREKYNPHSNYPVIGVIARYTELKGIEYIIRAFKKILDPYPNAKLILANVNGDYKPFIEKELLDIPEKNYTEIPFENDIASLYHLFDIYIHVPIDEYIEAFGQTYIESMASGIPGIFTLSGIGNDVCKHRKNCIVVNYKNSEQIYEAINLYLSNELFRKSISKNAQNSVNEFGLSSFIDKLEMLYTK